MKCDFLSGYCESDTSFDFFEFIEFRDFVHYFFGTQFIMFIVANQEERRHSNEKDDGSSTKYYYLFKHFFRSLED